MTLAGRRFGHRFRGITTHAWGQCLQDDSGSQLVEFAIAITALMTAMVGIFGGGLLLYTDHYVASAASEGARYAMVRGSTWGGVACATSTSASCTAKPDSVQAHLLAMAPLGVKAASTTILTTWPGTTAAGTACYAANGTKGAGCSVTVAVSYSFKLSLPLLPKKTLLLSSSSTMPITQ